MENAGFLFAAFSIIWASFFVYIFVLWQRQRQIRREIDALKELLEERGAKTEI